MKKVIAVLPEGTQILTTAETTVKNKWWITYNLHVEQQEGKYQHGENNQLVPKVGMMMTGVNGFIYKIAVVEPVYNCRACYQAGETREGKNRIGNMFYCNRHFNKLVVTKPIVKTGAIQSRNETCACGSGKKFKNCCGIKAADHTARHYFNSEYISQQQKTA